jgi:hypothetical protein
MGEEKKEDMSFLDTDWNQANAVHFRIHLSLIACNEAKYRQNFDYWWKALMNLRSEIVGSLTQKEFDKSLNDLKALGSYKENNMIGDVAYEFLMLEDYLRVCMRNHGLDLPRKKNSLMNMDSDDF